MFSHRVRPSVHSQPSTPFSLLGIFDIEIVKNTGFKLVMQQFRALLLKRMINSTRNFLVLIAALLPSLFVVISLIIEQQIPKPADSPSLLMGLDRYEQGSVPYDYARSDNQATAFIRTYESYLQQLSKPPTLIDLTANNSRPCQDGQPTDVVSYLSCIGQRSIMELSDQYMIGASAFSDAMTKVLNVVGYFNNQPFHVPPVSLNAITNTLLRQYANATTANSSIYVVNHPVRTKMTLFR